VLFVARVGKSEWRHWEHRSDIRDVGDNHRPAHVTIMFLTTIAPFAALALMIWFDAFVAWVGERLVSAYDQRRQERAPAGAGQRNDTYVWNGD
jgi:hypothetical protein